jgi:hypothetical protein
MVRSDHKATIAYTRDTIKAERTNSFFRDTRAQKIKYVQRTRKCRLAKVMEYGQILDEMINNVMGVYGRDLIAVSRS